MFAASIRPFAAVRRPGRTTPAAPGPVAASACWRRGLAQLLVALLGLGTEAPQALDTGRLLQAAQARGPQALAGWRALEALIDAHVADDEAAQLALINDFFNRRIRYATDLVVWGRIDYWASPLETLAQGRGDCEDYVIAKYFSLLALGMPVAKLRLVYVRAELAGTTQAHMVLAYYAAAGAEPLILDNLVGALLPASRRPDLEPVFSFNGEGLWQGTGALADGDPVARLSPWRELLAKVHGEGFAP